jgi:hypothetical protein
MPLAVCNVEGLENSLGAEPRAWAVSHVAGANGSANTFLVAEIQAGEYEKTWVYISVFGKVAACGKFVIRCGYHLGCSDLKMPEISLLTLC